MPIDLISIFGAGMLTLLTPCILPVLPVWLSLLMGTGADASRSLRSRSRMVTASLLFVAGFSLVFTLLGLGASKLGFVLQHHRSTLLVAGGMLIVLFGLKYLGVFRASWMQKSLQMKSIETGSRALDALLFGVVFALGWTPCVGPILGSVLTYTTASTSSPLLGALYLLTYSLGVGVPFLVVSLMADRLVPRIRKLHRFLPVFEKLTGAVMIAVGLLLVLPTVIRWAGPHRDDASSVIAVAADGTESALHLGDPSARPRLVEFYAQGCPVCQRMAPRIHQLREDCLGQKVDVVTVNLSDPRNAAVAERHAVRAVPTIKLFASDGKETGQLLGERQLAELRAAAAGLMETACAGVANGSVHLEPDGTPGCQVASERPSQPTAPATGPEPEPPQCTQ